MMTPAATSAELAEARAGLYRLLAEVYTAPPSVDFLRRLAGWVETVGDTVGPLQLPEQMRSSLDRLTSFFRGIKDELWEGLANSAGAEFVSLFRGMKRDSSPPPPYESLYREEGGRVFGESSIQVRRLYRHFGIDLAAAVSNEPPDHIGFELDFMRFLCSKEARAWKDLDASEALKFLLAEQEFLREHLTAWVSRFCDEVRARDRLGLYRILADFTEGWVIFDFEQHLQGEIGSLEHQ